MKILFYNDAPTFGGHEVMFLKILSDLMSSKHFDIEVVYGCDNKMLAEELSALRAVFPKIRLVAIPYSSRKLQFLRSFLSLPTLLQVRKIILEFSPDRVVVVQGDISLSSICLLASRLTRIKTISYLPMAHTRRERGEKYSCVKDQILKLYYKLPDAYVTISKAVARRIRTKGFRGRIDIVGNVVDGKKIVKVSKDEARKKLGIGASKKVAALCGRIEFQQKGHDVLVRALDENRLKLEGWQVLIIGEGPDELNLKTLILDKDLASFVTVMPWQKDLTFVYSAIDVLLMPSLFEGVPLVLLEAMSLGIPIVASDLPEFREMLPSGCLFPLSSPAQLIDRMVSIQRSGTLLSKKGSVGVTPISENGEVNRVDNFQRALI